MNQKYFEIPIEKQNKMANAGYKVFAVNSYKKASMAAIADEAGISKSLLFYYFKNKKELYLYLFDIAVKFIYMQTTEGIYGKKHDLFELVTETIDRRMNTLLRYPYIYKFIAKGYYEAISEIKCEVDKRKTDMLTIGMTEIMDLIECDKFEDPGELQIVVSMIINIGEGFMRGREELDYNSIQEIIPGFLVMMESLKRHYYKKEFLQG